VDEFEARITAVLRRSRSKEPVPEHVTAELRVGDLVVVPSRATATIGGHTLQLTPTEYRLLLHLASHPDDVLSRRALAAVLWGYADDGTDHMIDVHIGRLRRKIRDTGGESIIVTVHGAGYMLCGDSAYDPAP
jgi:two-component system, OmpR family, alkaline phosphatase synthesis response regulator PhoP